VRRSAYLIPFSVAAAAVAAPPLVAQETPKDIIAAHIRLQGYACDSPRSAKRLRAASRPDEAVWIISCAQAKYRVRLVPDQADVVERID
jgi:hypothetical protein